MNNNEIYNSEKNSIEGIQHMSTRLKQMGGYHQQERMILDKRRTLDRVIWNSYQGAEVRKIDTDKIVRCLINPNKLKQDYDDKIISIGFEHGFKCGDVFEWKNTNTHWLIYLQDLTELAYFRGDIRKCSYKISWEDEEGKHSTYAAIRGPVETKINYIQKHGISVDTPNYSLNILMPLNENSLKYFQRYNKFYLSDFNSTTNQICWRVEAIDSISSPGILEVNAVEYYSNKIEDDIENGVVGGLIVKPDNPNSEEIEETIIGETFIKPKTYYTYFFQGTSKNQWIIDNELPIKYEILDDNSIKLKWNATFSGQFNLSYGDFVKTIIVESLF